MSRSVRINSEGQAWCHHRDWKRVYSSLDQAWIAAFLLFLQTGSITTPYRCGRSRKYIAEYRVRITQNPYAFDPFVRFVRSRKIRIQGCGMWHLTSLTSHALVTADGLWNLAGKYVGPDRACMRADGLPKKIFESEAAASEFLDARSMRTLEPYVCARKHWHVGGKFRRPIIVRR